MGERKKMSRKLKSQSTPFLVAAAVWLAVGTGLCALSKAAPTAAAVTWFGFFWGLSILDLGIIWGLVFSIGSWEGARDRARLGLRIGILVLLKLIVLMIFGLILFLKHGIPQPSLLLGLGTLIVIPLLGGLAWSFQPSPPEPDDR